MEIADTGQETMQLEQEKQLFPAFIFGWLLSSISQHLKGQFNRHNPQEVQVSGSAFKTPTCTPLGRNMGSNSSKVGPAVASVV